MGQRGKRVLILIMNLPSLIDRDWQVISVFCSHYVFNRKGKSHNGTGEERKHRLMDMVTISNFPSCNKTISLLCLPLDYNDRWEDWTLDTDGCIQA